MTDMTKIMDELQVLIRDILDNPEVEITASTSARDVPEWDSLNHVRIIAAVEKKFAIRMTSAEIEKIKTAGNFAALIASKVA